MILRPKDIRDTLLAMNYKISKKELKIMFENNDDKDSSKNNTLSNTMKNNGSGNVGMTLDDMKNLLLDNEVMMDPAAEAFNKVLDPTASGFISKERLLKIVSNLNYGGKL